MKRSESTAKAPRTDSNVHVEKPAVGITLQDRAIVLVLNVSIPTSSKKDKRITDESLSREGADKNTGRFVKNLFNHESMAALKAVSTKLRQQFYEVTLPWGREGQGVVKIDKYIDVKTKLNDTIREFYAARDTAVAAYDDMIEADKAKLGAAFNRADYPSKQQFADGIGVKLSPLPIEKTDFRSGYLPPEEVALINEQIADRVASEIAQVERRNVERVREKVSHLLSRIIAAANEGTIHVAALTNAQDVLKNARDLNITENASVTSLFDALDGVLNSIDINEIRESKVARQNAEELTKAALAALDDTMKGFV